jgi:hypothetical protein
MYRVEEQRLDKASNRMRWAIVGKHPNQPSAIAQARHWRRQGRKVRIICERTGQELRI